MNTKNCIRRLRLRAILAASTLVIFGQTPTVSAADDLPAIISADDYRARETERSVETASYKDVAPIPSAIYNNDCSDCGADFIDCQCGPASVACSPKPYCPPPWWAHRHGAFGEFLLLRPGSTDMIYAVEQTDPDPAVASPTGPTGITNIDGEAGFRVGFSLAASDCSSVVTRYTNWHGDTTSSITAQGANVLDSLVVHPSVATSGAASLAAASSQSMSFETVDTAYRHLWKASDVLAVNWQTGLRYGNLEQRSRTDQTLQVATGLTNVATDLDFEGFGITGGLDFERYSCASGLSIYGKGMVSALAGDWKARYRQTNQFGGGVIASQLKDFRVTPVLDTELGLGWTGMNGHLRIHGGLLVSAWYDAMTTRSYVESVRDGRLNDIEETLTFTGMTTGLELRY